MRKRYGIFLCILFMLSLLLAGCKEDEDTKSIKPSEKGIAVSNTGLELGLTSENYPSIDGSTSTLPLVQEIYKAMVVPTGEGEEWLNLPQTPSKTVPSYKKLIAGEVDMIFVPYASQDILKEAENQEVELEFFPVSTEALIFITSKDNTAQNITEEQVRSIYIDYAIDNWKEMGGPDKELIPLCRNADSGSQSQLDNLILKGQPMNERIKENFVELTMDGLLEQVAFYHNVSERECFGLGYTLYHYLQNVDGITGIGEKLRILNYEGIPATSETIKDGSYPLVSNYYAVVRKDLPKDHAVRKIIEWLKTDDGGKCIRRSGLYPVT